MLSNEEKKLLAQKFLAKKAMIIYKYLLKCSMQNTKYLTDISLNKRFYYMGPRYYYGYIDDENSVIRIITYENFYIQIPADSEGFVKTFVADVTQGLQLLRIFQNTLPAVIKYQKSFFKQFWRDDTMTVFYHGTSTAANIDKEILPATETGNLREANRKIYRDKVWASDFYSIAADYAKKACEVMGGEPVVYVVRLQGNIEEVHPHEYIADRAIVRGIEERHE